MTEDDRPRREGGKRKFSPASSDSRSERPRGTRSDARPYAKRDGDRPRRDGDARPYAKRISLPLGDSNTDVATFIKEKSTLIPNTVKAVADVLNTESGDTIDDQDGNPIEI